MAERRILFLITDLEIGGTPTVVRELAIRLGALVHTQVACLKPAGPVAGQLRAAGMTATSLAMTSATHIQRTVTRLRELIARDRIDTVCSFLVHANALATAASRPMPTVRLFQSIQTVQPTPAWHWWLQRLVVGAAERVIVPSGAIADYASRRCRIPPERFAVIPNAIEPAEFTVAARWQGGPIRLGYLGRLDPNKSPQDLPAVLDHLPARCPAELHFFGEGPERARLEQLAAEPRYAGRIVLHGAVAQPQDALSTMDILLLPSRVEGFGLVLIEAMASGVPVIAVASGGVTEVVRDEVNGLLVAPTADAGRAFAGAVTRLLEDGALRSRLIEDGLATVQSRFSWSRILPQYREVLGLT